MSEHKVQVWRHSPATMNHIQRRPEVRPTLQQIQELERLQKLVDEAKAHPQHADLADMPSEIRTALSITDQSASRRRAVGIARDGRVRKWASSCRCHGGGSS